MGVLQTLRSSWEYRRTIIYLLRTKGVKSAYNFVFVKMFVKEGEGGAGLAFHILNPLLERFPSLLPKIAPYPYNVEVEITNKCNKRCLLCEHTYWNEPSVDLSFADFKRIVDQFPKLKWVNLTGEGDAFLNKDYLQMIRYLKEKKVPVFLVDSFDMINEEIARQLIEMGVDGIWVSMDGATKETYEKIKVGCNLDRTLEHLRTLLRLKKEMNSPIPEICFRYIVTTLNIHDVPRFFDLVSSLGNRKSLGDGSKVEYVGLLSFPEIKHLYVPEIPQEMMNSILKRSEEMGIPVQFAHSTKLRPMVCCTAWLEPYIMMGGYVMPCCAVLMSNKRDFLRKHALGNIFEQSFKEIWNSERYKKMRKMVPKDEGKVPILCQGCRAYDTTERERLYGVAEDY